MKHLSAIQRRACRWAVLAFWLTAAPWTDAADTLKWNHKENRVGASFTGCSLEKFLEQLTDATGWEIFVQPGTRQTISVKFADRTPGDALRLLFGDLNFALVPQTNGPAKFFVFRTTASEATQPVKSVAKNGRIIPNELIVRLKPGQSIDALAKKLGAKVIGRAGKFNAYRLQFESEEAANAAREALKGESDVASVENNYEFPRPAEGAENASGNAPSLNLKPKPLSDSDRLVVGVLDTAVQAKAAGIQDFLLNPPADETGGDTPTHGTAMTEKILDVLSKLSQNGQTSVRIALGDIYHGNAYTTSFDIGQGLIDIIEKYNPTVINISSGGKGDSAFLQDVTTWATQGGRFIFAAAGNDHSGDFTFPASYPGVTSVSSSDPSGNLASFANFNDAVALMLPGQSVVWLGNRLYLIEGTSVSSAAAAGAAAAAMDVMKLTPAQARELLFKTFGVKPGTKL